MNNFFYIENSTLATMNGEPFLKGSGKYEGHHHSKLGLELRLKSRVFLSANQELIPIFKKALEMMEAGQTGRVEI